MRVAIFSSRRYERPFLDDAIAAVPARLRPTVTHFDTRLSLATAGLAKGYPVVSIFVGDDGSEPTLSALHAGGTRALALRCAGFNHVDLAHAAALGLTVLRVPAYSPYAVAEHTVGLILTLNRKLHRAYNRVREQNFALDGLMGFDMHGRSVGVVGTGRIGQVLCRILAGFGCTVLAADPNPAPACIDMGVTYLPLDDLLRQSDIVSLQCPLTPATHHLINGRTLALMKPGAMLINTSRGGVIDTRALIVALKSGHLGAVGLDVYEEEADLFFNDLSDRVIQDDVFARLMTFPNVLITAHQGFFTRQAMEAIAATTAANITGFSQGSPPTANLVTSELVVPK
ncbi:D-lactate dehydrogenase [Enhygromyxa salina]|uniref:D-lactate dehydrogenase n=1 Tax=Enhygromyxa salina TaxID=215803 RepID=A0A0C2A0C4_9BACT|nr:2-hydroxyacid dehydrogenase [Enhygromyxa salina]KIG16818.1 D-lactate dehydrogenase [Enhygromyxa salina]